MDKCYVPVILSTFSSDLLSYDDVLYRYAYRFNLLSQIKLSCHPDAYHMLPVVTILVPLKYFNSQFQSTKVAHRIKIPQQF
jgi:hypothetical protein